MAKIQFSPEESSLVQHADLILTKNRIMAKLCSTLGELGKEMMKEWKRHDLISGKSWNMFKVSKGENFQGLPYIVLDFPREFAKHDVMAIRTMFWWGNYFSITLQLKGKYKGLFEARLKKNLSLFSQNDFLISISDDEWAHQVDPAHYDQLSNFSAIEIERILQSRTFLKLVKKISLDQWQNATDMLWENFLIILDGLEN